MRTLVPSIGRFGNFRLTARKITRPLFRLTNRPSRRPPAKVPSLSQKLNRRGVGCIQWPAGTVATYVKFGMYERPTLGVALALTLDAAGREVVGARVAVGCVNPRPRRFPSVERLACGRTLTDVK